MPKYDVESRWTFFNVQAEDGDDAIKKCEEALTVNIAEHPTTGVLVACRNTIRLVLEGEE